MTKWWTGQDSDAQVIQRPAYCSSPCVLACSSCLRPPLAHSISDHDKSTAVTAQSLQSPWYGGSANNSTDLPPGTSESGIDNVIRLTEAHRAVLNDSLYAAQMEWDQVFVASCRGSSGFEVVPISMTIPSEVNRSYTGLVSVFNRPASGSRDNRSLLIEVEPRDN